MPALCCAQVLLACRSTISWDLKQTGQSTLRFRLEDAAAHCILFLLTFKSAGIVVPVPAGHSILVFCPNKRICEQASVMVANLLVQVAEKSGTPGKGAAASPTGACPPAQMGRSLNCWV